MPVGAAGDGRRGGGAATDSNRACMASILAQPPHMSTQHGLGPRLKIPVSDGWLPLRLAHATLLPWVSPPKNTSAHTHLFERDQGVALVRLLKAQLHAAEHPLLPVAAAGEHKTLVAKPVSARASLRGLAGLVLPALSVGAACVAWATGCRHQPQGPSSRRSGPAAARQWKLRT